MSSRYPIHKDWCHVSHDGPCLREDQRAPNATAAEREGEEPDWWVDDEIFGLLGDAGVATYAGIDSRGPYRTGWTKAELRLATALRAARQDANRYRALASAVGDERILVYVTDEGEDSLIAGSLGLEALAETLHAEQEAWAKLLAKRTALAATPEET